MVFGMGNCTKSKILKGSQVVVSVIGLDDAGKTTSVKVLKGDGDIKDIAPTVGFEPHEFQYNGVQLVLNDLGGSSRVRDIWKHYLAESYGFVFVIDASNRNRIYECSKTFSAFIESDKVTSKPVLILANKQEMPNAMDESEIVQYLNVEELVNKYQIPCRIEMCSASSGVGSNADEAMKVGFDWLIKYISHEYEGLKLRIDHDVSLQRGRESKIKSEKYDRIKQQRQMDSYDDDMENYDQNSVDPWKALNSLNKSSKNSSSSLSDSKLSAYDKQLIEEMKSSNSRLTTIDEERSRLKNRFMKTNKLAPLDDGPDPLKARSFDNDRSWAITESKKSPSLSRPRRFE